MSENDPNFNPQNYNTQQYQFNNQGFNSSSALQIRFDTEDKVIENLSPLFKGCDVRTVMDENGNARQIVVWQGMPMCNDRGYQAIMRWLRIFDNSQVLQGNMEDREYFGRYMMNLHQNIAQEMVSNRSLYGIPKEQLQVVVQNLTSLAYPILTRTLYDRERQAMNNTVKVQETMTTQPQKGLFGNPFGGRR